MRGTRGGRRDLGLVGAGAAAGVVPARHDVDVDDLRDVRVGEGAREGGGGGGGGGVDGGGVGGCVGSGGGVGQRGAGVVVVVVVVVVVEGGVGFCGEEGGEEEEEEEEGEDGGVLVVVGSGEMHGGEEGGRGWMWMVLSFLYMVLLAVELLRGGEVEIEDFPEELCIGGEIYQLMAWPDSRDWTRTCAIFSKEDKERGFFIRAGDQAGLVMSVFLLGFLLLSAKERQRLVSHNFPPPAISE